MYFEETILKSFVKLTGQQYFFDKSIALEFTWNFFLNFANFFQNSCSIKQILTAASA